MFEELIVISDLHLSDGYNKNTGKYSRNEDFFFDEEFKRFLEYLQNKFNRKNRFFHLIIAGDMFDFLQVDPDGDRVEQYEEFLKEERKKELKKHDLDTNESKSDVRKKERKFGLGTGKIKTVWKLGQIVNGHPVFFQALANFVSAKNRISIITGNHDIELYWPEVQDALRDHILSKLPANAPEIEQSKAKKCSIEFYPWFYYDEEYKTYIEHGNQYDRMNSFKNILYPHRKPGSEELWLPFGSFFVRYFFNKLEASNPFADNMKPFTKYMRWAWEEDKIQFLKNIILYLPTMFRLFFKGWMLPGTNKKLEEQNMEVLKNLPSILKLKLKQFDVATLRNIYSLKEAPFTSKNLLNIFTYSTFFFFVIATIISISLFVRSYWFVKLPFKTSLLPSLCSFLGTLIIPFFRWLLKFFQKDIFEKILPKIKEQLKDVQIIIFGHTHDPDIRIVTPDCKYFNTGTWTTVFSEEERIIREAKQFAFIWITKEGGKPQATLNRWNDSLKLHEKLVLFEPMSGTKLAGQTGISNQ